MVLPLLAAIAPWLPAIGGAVAGIGALMAPKPEPQTQTTTGSIDLGRLRADAEAAGFNPLTIIRGGGLSGYGASHTVTSAAPDMRLSNAFQAFGSGLANVQWDPYGQQRSQTELRLMEAQIADFGRRGSAPSGLSFQTPKAKSTDPGLTVLRKWGGTPWTTGPGSPTQDVENEYGEVAGELYGFPRFVRDAIGHELKPVRMVSWDQTGWKIDPKGTPSKIITGGGF